MQDDLSKALKPVLVPYQLDALKPTLALDQSDALKPGLSR